MAYLNWTGLWFDETKRKGFLMKKGEKFDFKKAELLALAGILAGIYPSNLSEKKKGQSSKLALKELRRRNLPMKNLVASVGEAIMIKMVQDLLLTLPELVDCLTLSRGIAIAAWRQIQHRHLSEVDAPLARKIRVAMVISPFLKKEIPSSLLPVSGERKTA